MTNWSWEYSKAEDGQRRVVCPKCQKEGTLKVGVHVRDGGGFVGPYYHVRHGSMAYDAADTITGIWHYVGKDDRGLDVDGALRDALLARLGMKKK